MHADDIDHAPVRWLRWLVPQRAPSLPELASADWPALVAASRAHHLSPALHVALRDADLLEQVPATARAALQEDYQRAGFDVMVWRRALGLVLPALAAESVVAIPYKGAALAFLVYSDPAARLMSDIDLWIARDDMSRACDVLERLGFERRENPQRPIALQSGYDGEVPFHGRRIGVPLVELHWGVFPGEWLRRTTRIDRDALRDRTRPAELFGTPVRILSPEDHLIQVAVHAAVTHVFSQATLRSLFDIVVLAAAGVDWETVVARARHWRLATVLGHALQLTGELFALPDLLDAAQRLISPARLRHLSRLVDADVILSQRRRDRGLRKWLYLSSAVDRDADRLRLLMRGVWPEREWLGARYGNDGLPTRARHFASALRGRF